MYISFAFFEKQYIPFYRTVVFLICKMYTFDQYFWLQITNTYTTKLSISFGLAPNHEHLYNKTVDNFCSSTSLAHFVQWHPINAQNLQTEHFSVFSA